MRMDECRLPIQSSIYHQKYLLCYAHLSVYDVTTALQFLRVHFRFTSSAIWDSLLDFLSWI